MPRQFFVGGNFKMYVLYLLPAGVDRRPACDVFMLTDYRNGSVETIKKIIGYLNQAELDPKTGS